MKTIIVLLLLLVAFSNSQAQTSKVYFVREHYEKGNTYAGTYNLFIDERIVCKLDKDCYSIQNVPPGEHIFGAQWSGKESKKKAPKIKMNIDSGKYYFKILYNERFGFNGGADFVHLEEITERAAKELMQKLKPDDNCIK